MLPFVANCLRYDIGFAVQWLSRYLSKAHRIHFSWAKQMLCYLSGSLLVVIMVVLLRLNYLVTRIVIGPVMLVIESRLVDTSLSSMASR